MSRVGGVRPTTLGAHAWFHVFIAGHEVVTIFFFVVSRWNVTGIRAAAGIRRGRFLVGFEAVHQGGRPHQGMLTVVGDQTTRRNKL